MAAIDLVIFDCDGVLVDSEPLAVAVDVAMLAELGWPLTEAEVIDRFIGRSHRFMVSEIEAHVGRRLPPGWEARSQERLHESFATDLVAVDGIADALDQITVSTCVASSGSHDKMRYTLGLTGLYDRFAGRIFSAEEVDEGKPAPDLFLHAAERMGVAPGACAVVEDSRWGIQAARAAGMRSFGFAGSVTPGAALAAAGAVVFDDMRDLPQLLTTG
jgi:HAD superfamily hydrolase (TIGR01509 family)